MFSAVETRAMRRALEIARTAGVPLGPNPRVGCVLLAPDGSEVAEGYHRGAGTPHAEAVALANAGDDARGATAVVTLEPCNHTGRTGPCAQALLDAGVSARGVSRSPTATRSRPAEPRPCVRPGADVAEGLLLRRGARPEPGVDVRDGPRPAVRDLEVRDHARRAQRRRRRQQPLGELACRPGRLAPAARAVRRDAGRHQHRGGGRPGAHRARRVRRADAAPAAPRA